MQSTADRSDLLPHELRRRIRRGDHTGNTSGMARGFVQCNVVILPAQYAADFERFCHLNPKPCPLLAISDPGDPTLPSLGDIDLRHDIPAYRVFRDGQLLCETCDIADYWCDDLVGFALGCSFSFEEALLQAGLSVRNIDEGVNVPMYRTGLDCEPAGNFSSKLIVSMRPFTPADAARAAEISGRYPMVHGAPVHIGDPAAIGIANIDRPDFGDRVTFRNGEIPVFWACGVTPQLALQSARPSLAITHSPGCMLVTDLTNAGLVGKADAHNGSNRAD